MAALAASGNSGNDPLNGIKDIWGSYMSRAQDDANFDFSLNLSSTLASHRAATEYLTQEIRNLEECLRPRQVKLSSRVSIEDTEEIHQQNIDYFSKVLLANKHYWEKVELVVTTPPGWRASRVAKLLEALVGAKRLQRLSLHGIGGTRNTLLGHRLQEILSFDNIHTLEINAMRNIDWKTLNEITTAIRRNSSLKVLRIEDNSDFGHFILECLCQTQAQLTSLSLRGQQLHYRWSLDYLEKLVEHQKSLQFLNLSDNHSLLDVEVPKEFNHLKSLFGTFAVHHELQSIHLGGCPAPRHIWALILQMFSHKLQKQFSLVYKGFKIFTTAQRNAMTIGSVSHSLWVRGPDLECAIEQLVKLQQSQSLVLDELVLHRCYQWGALCERFIRSLFLESSHCQISTLRLDTCRMTPSALEYLASALRRLPTLHSLTLHKCAIQYVMASHLFSDGLVLSSDPMPPLTVRNLNLSGNEMDGSSLPLLNSHLQQNPELESLDLSRNLDLFQARESEFTTFVDRIVNHPRLCKLSISNNRNDENSCIEEKLGQLFAGLGASDDSKLRELDLSETPNLDVGTWATSLPALNNLRVLRLPRHLPHSTTWSTFIIHLQKNLSITKIDLGGGPGLDDDQIREITRRNELLWLCKSFADVPISLWPAVLSKLSSNNGEASPGLAFFRGQNLTVAFPLVLWSSVSPLFAEG